MARASNACRVLEEDADVDEDVAKLLDGTDGDPDKIREKASPLILKLSIPSTLCCIWLVLLYALLNFNPALFQLQR
jgi:hypothetical protein